MNNKRVEILPFGDEWFDGPLMKFKELLEQAIEKIPEEFRESARIEADYYGESHEPYKIIYWRPKTQEEIDADTREQIARYKEQLQSKRQQYDKLKRELGL